ncbi:MAG TPA: HAD-IB family hydrolase [Myxococcaceae bacterium]|nr:HAD-IB family hydrolase [Myxococcaceae bacterium]
MTPAKAAFFDIEGTLVRTNMVHAYAYYAAHRGSALGIAARTLGAIASIPAFAGLDLVDRKSFQTFYSRYYAGLSEDRLVTLAEDLCEDVLRPALYPQARDLIDEARRAGCRIVMVSGALDFTVAPLARYLGADVLIANRLQFVGGVATGKLIPPVIEGANKANAVRNYCVQEGVALDQSFAYSDSVSDYAMLAVVGRPTAVNPDFRLRALARAYHWPVLDLS